MVTSELQRQMRGMQWNANKRTMRQRPRVNHETIERAQAAVNSGAHDLAIEILSEVSADVQGRDYGALTVLGLANFGLGNKEDALNYFNRADQVTQQMRARSLLNKANVKKVCRQYADAMADAQHALELAPEFSAAHLMIFAIIENERPENRSELLSQSVSHMKQVWPSWREDHEFWSYMMTDIDYSQIRESGELSILFGEPPQDFDLKKEIAQ